MSEVKKCEEHPHLSYYADLDLHAKLAKAEHDSDNRYQSAPAVVDGGRNSEVATEKPAGILRRAFRSGLKSLLWLLLSGLAIIWFLLVGQLSEWASTLVEVETQIATSAELETRLVGGVIPAIGYGLPIVGLFGFTAIHLLVKFGFITGFLATKKAIVGLIAALLILSFPFLSDVMAPHHVSVSIDPTADQITVSREFFLKSNSELVVRITEIQTVEKETVKYTESDKVNIYLKMRDGSTVKLIDSHTPGFDNVLRALLRVTDLPLEQRYVDER